MNAELDPKAKKGRPDWEKGAAHAKTLGPRSSGALQE